MNETLIRIRNGQIVTAAWNDMDIQTRRRNLRNLTKFEKTCCREAFKKITGKDWYHNETA